MESCLGNHHIPKKLTSLYNWNSTGLGMFQAALTRLLSCSLNLLAELAHEARAKLCLKLCVCFKEGSVPEQDGCGVAPLKHLVSHSRVRKSGAEEGDSLVELLLLRLS